MQATSITRPYRSATAAARPICGPEAASLAQARSASLSEDFSIPHKCPSTAFTHDPRAVASGARNGARGAGDDSADKGFYGRADGHPAHTDQCHPEIAQRVCNLIFTHRA